MPKKPTHGGPRPGAGRKPKPESEKFQPIAFRVHPKTIKAFRTKAKRAKMTQAAFFTKLTEEAK